MARQLEPRSACGWPAAWSLVFAARTAAAQFATVPGADDDLALTYAALDLTYALAEIEHIEALLPTPAADVGQVVGSEPEPDAPETFDDLLAAADRIVTELAAGVDATPAAVLSAVRVRGLVAVARGRVSGGER